MKKIIISCVMAAGIISSFSPSAFCAAFRHSGTNQPQSVYQKYLNFFEEIYQTMDENYYYPVHRADYERFLKKFDDEIYANLDHPDEWNDFVSMRSGAFLVDFLRTPDDRFSALFPPHLAEEYEQEVLGKRIDLGITGHLTDKGFVIAQLEPRSDAYQKGLRIQDVIQAIDGQDVLGLQEDEIQSLLKPSEGTSIQIGFLEATTQMKKMIEVMSQEYFHQTVFPVDVPIPNIFCLRIERFNRKTAEDLFQYLALINQQGLSGLILDLRSNPGGPPLAARELASFFLTPHQDLVYFARKGQEKNFLDVPEIPEEFRFSGPVVILVDEQSGSAAELFSGIMQKQGRAMLMGATTAGQVFLKSMFSFDNETMLLLVTARGHYPDGEPFSFEGITPRYPIAQDEADAVLLAAGYLFQVMQSMQQRMGL